MKIEILVSHALINQDTGQTAGLHQTVDAPKERAEYLVSIGAAREAAKAPQKAEKPAEEAPAPEDGEKAPAPARKPAPAPRKPAGK